MSNHIETDERTVPYYAIHTDDKICGFFGPFRFLSNFYPLQSGVWYEELTYPSVEHAYQAAKWPIDKRVQFLNILSWEAKALGKLAPNFNKKRWDKNKISLMTSLCHQKFEKNKKLRNMLLLTENIHLEEMNNWGDMFWGTNINGFGENHLGKILMTIRKEWQNYNPKNVF